MPSLTLINPPQFTRYPQPPLGLALLAAILDEKGYRTTILDANALGLRPEEVVPLVAGADIVGLTAMTPTVTAALDIARRLKQAVPGRKLIMGGAHATLLPEETLRAAPEIDYIVRGEGDVTLFELLEALKDNRPVSGVAGLSYATEGGIIHTADRPPLMDIDALPFAAYHLLPRERYRPHPPHGVSHPFAAVVTSRGCPYRCAYCSKPVFGTKFRAQSAGRVVAELAYLQEKFGVKEIAFYDDSFTLDKKRVHEIADKMLSAGLKLAWTCETRVNLVDRELLRHMKQAGCYAVAYGIESASPEIIKTLCKDTTLAQVEEAVAASRAAGLQVVGYFMLGSPGETPETIRQTIDFAKKLKVDFAQFSLTTPFPGTELYDIYMKDRREAIPWESFVYAGTDNAPRPVFESGGLDRKALEYWLRQAYREFYLRPAYIWQRLVRIRSLDEVKMDFKGLGMLLNSIK
jgi:anaerobic magnesium-protoporphyrin IX monomethyl ester cyclase